MTHEEQQELFDAIMTRSAAPDTFSPYTGVYLTALSDGGAEAELVLAPHHMNPMGIVHGGVYCTLMDHAAGAAACTRGSRCLTVDCETRFIGVPTGDKLYGHARAVRMGRTIVVMRAWVTDSADILCAEGTYTFRMKEGFPKA